MIVRKYLTITNIHKMFGNSELLKLWKNVNSGFTYLQMLFYVEKYFKRMLGT